MVSFLLNISFLLMFTTSDGVDNLIRKELSKKLSDRALNQEAIQELILTEFLDRYDTPKTIEQFRTESIHFGQINNSLVNDCISDSLMRSFTLETYVDFTNQNGPMNDSVNLVTYRFRHGKITSNFLLSMSNCGFSQDLTQAMMYYEITAGGIGGGGAIAVFKKTKAGWNKECEVWPWKS